MDISDITASEMRNLEAARRKISAAHVGFVFFNDTDAQGTHEQGWWYVYDLRGILRRKIAASGVRVLVGKHFEHLPGHDSKVDALRAAKEVFPSAASLEAGLQGFDIFE